jgi:hypothetical protein
MNQGKYVFAQICSFLPQRAFDTIVSRYSGDYRVRHFTCWNQMLCMMYGQLSNRDSLSDLALTVNAHSPKASNVEWLLPNIKSTVSQFQWVSEELVTD